VIYRKEHEISIENLQSVLAEAGPIQLIDIHAPSREWMLLGIIMDNALLKVCVNFNFSKMNFELIDLLQNATQLTFEASLITQAKQPIQLRSEYSQLYRLYSWGFLLFHSSQIHSNFINDASEETVILYDLSYQKVDLSYR
jgi:hypothetical protein